jgi:hypothetical protein
MWRNTNDNSNGPRHPKHTEVEGLHHKAGVDAAGGLRWRGRIEGGVRGHFGLGGPPLLVQEWGGKVLYWSCQHEKGESKGSQITSS